jgi:hypothetical protein
MTEQRESKLVFLPKNLQFTYQGAYNFARALAFFDWSVRDVDVTFVFEKCKQANYQTLSLLVLYIWYLKVNNNCRVRFHFGEKDWGATKMWQMMDAESLFSVLESEKPNFDSANVKPLLAVRDNTDFSEVLNKAKNYTEGFGVEYEKTLRYVLSELLYNTLEHGCNPQIPSIAQFSWYRSKNEISFIVADLGIGIKNHLSQAYPGIENDASAIELALKPKVSGTFVRNEPYTAKNNAGVGLFLSSNVIRKLNADMHVVSGNGVVHISPRDVTARTITTRWNGTFVYVTVKLGVTKNLSYQKMMIELRAAAMRELSQGSKQEQKENYYFNVKNHFGSHAEDKESAIRIRDKYLFPQVHQGKSLIIDFESVMSAPHSFLSALLATSIRHLGIQSYKKMKIVNAAPEIRETIDFIMDENT